MTRKILLAAAALCAATACNDTEAAQLPAPATAQPARASLDARSQFDLALAIDQADRSEDPELAYARVRKDWLGKRYRWSVYRIAPLCRSAESCNVLPFDRGGRDARVVQGWMPRLALDDGAMKAIAARCGDLPRCEIAFEATLSQMTLSLDKPTSLAFDQVAVVSR
jgi:hypothetical protein